MKPETIARQRLAAQALSIRTFESPEHVVRSLGAVQSQEYRPATWSVAQRIRGIATPRAVEAAVADGSILRTHVLRPTWHFVHRDDIRWMLALSAPQVQGLVKHRHRELKLDAGTLARSTDVLADALRDGRHLTRREMLEVLDRARIDTEGQRGPHMLMHAELEATICSGAARDGQQTYALLDLRAPGAKTLPRDEALAELTRRYFLTRGPATLRDFRWWSGLRAADAKRGIALVDGDLERMDAEGRTYWFDGSVPAVRASATRVHLVQQFDEFLVAYSESRDVCDVANLLPRGESLARAVLLDGQVAGRWRLPAGGAFELELLRPVSDSQQRAITRAVRQYEQFCAA